MKLISDLLQLVKYLPVFYYNELNWSLVIIFGILPLLSGDGGGGGEGEKHVKQVEMRTWPLYKVCALTAGSQKVP